jgi:hypothetical protein
MIRLAVKLLIAGLIANAAWRVGSEYINFYAFQDEVRSEALQEEGEDDLLRERVVELATARGLPLSADEIDVRREERRVTVEGSYVKPIAVLPGYSYPWPFRWSVEAYVIAARPR